MMTLPTARPILTAQALIPAPRRKQRVQTRSALQAWTLQDLESGLRGRQVLEQPELRVVLLVVCRMLQQGAAFCGRLLQSEGTLCLQRLVTSERSLAL
mmetsp:Transcript_29537/g.64179  ORF Transcript_29537/g.64179 Transcript_29537/m.64179 type:complete len:98 (-) Transcript_29537:363-656(-)